MLLSTSQSPSGRALRERMDKQTGARFCIGHFQTLGGSVRRLRARCPTARERLNTRSQDSESPDKYGWDFSKPQPVGGLKGMFGPHAQVSSLKAHWRTARRWPLQPVCGLQLHAKSVMFHWEPYAGHWAEPAPTVCQSYRAYVRKKTCAFSTEDRPLCAMSRPRKGSGAHGQH